jgi:hypothetical protein
VTVYITAISPTNAGQHQHITDIRWVDSSRSTSNTMSRQRAVAWVRQGNTLVVAGTDGPVEVQVVDADPPYLRTVANGSFTDNLLALPKY